MRLRVFVECSATCTLTLRASCSVNEINWNFCSRNQRSASFFFYLLSQHLHIVSIHPVKIYILHLFIQSTSTHCVYLYSQYLHTVPIHPVNIYTLHLIQSTSTHCVYLYSQHLHTASIYTVNIHTLCQSIQ
uniref:Uncharacterized protein n=1 Tax=Octopus bimaculoides TaxID=37653 RepID=A0A0L8GJZ3_OCTBM